MNPLQPFIDRPIAHRTLHDVKMGRPENSYEGLDAAIALNLPVEIDLQLSRDGIPMVFHDYDLDRLTHETGLVADLDASALAKIPLKGGVRSIPRFDAFMDYIGGRVPVLIELKDQDGALGTGESDMETAVCEILKSYSGLTALMSFNPNMIARCARLAPDIPRGIVTDEFTLASWPDVPNARRKELKKILDYQGIGACFISHNRKYLSDDRVHELKSAGATIFCWTVKSAKQEVKAREVADSITFEKYLPTGLS